MQFQCKNYHQEPSLFINIILFIFSIQNKKRRKKNKKNKPDETKISNSEENKEIVAEELSPNTQKKKVSAQ